MIARPTAFFACRLAAFGLLVGLFAGGGCARSCRAYTRVEDRDLCFARDVMTMAQEGDLRGAALQIPQIETTAMRGAAVEVLLSNTSVEVAPDEILLLCRLGDLDRYPACVETWANTTGAP